MTKDQITKEFEDMLKAYPFIRVNENRANKCYDSLQEGVVKDGGLLTIYIGHNDSDEKISNYISLAQSMAGEMKRELDEIDLYKRQNPNLRERLEYIAWSIRK